MKARSILILSLGLNLLLACWAVAKARRAPAAGDPVSVPNTGEPPEKSVPLWRVQRTNITEVTTNRVDAPGFHWSMVETNDYDVFVANLRGVGCPEKTIRRIILADVEALYAQRLADVEEPLGFWANDAQRSARERRLEQKGAALAEEKRALLIRLVGADWSLKAAREWVDGEEPSFILGFLPDETALRLIEAAFRVERRTGAFRQETQRIVIDTDEPRLDALIADSIRDLHSPLSPADAQELMLRVYDLANGFLGDERFAGVTLTGAELKTIAGWGSGDLNLVELALRDQLDRAHRGDIEDIAKQVSPAVEAQVRQLLGEERFAAYTRSKDETFRDFARAAGQNNLPVDAAIKALEIRRTAEAAAKELKSNTSLAPDQRRAALDAMRNQSQQAMQAVVGAAAMKDFFRPDTGWAQSAFGARGGKKP